jgi:GT2 family glycosyltransferase
MSNPVISIAVCTYNRAELLEDVLQSLAGQTLDKSQFEVLVVDNNSSDNTEAVAKNIVKSQPNFRYLKELNQGKSHALNLGYKEARGEYVGSIDDDAKADPDWLRHAVKVIDEIAPDIFGGPYYPFYRNEKPEWMKEDYGAKHFDKSRFLRDSEYLSGSNIFFKKSLLEDLGGYEPQLGPRGLEIGYGEETDLIVKARKAGARIYYCHEMKVYHLVPEYKMNPFWHLVIAFEHGRNRDRMFHTEAKSGQVEMAYSLLDDIKALFDEMRLSIFTDDKPGSRLENRIKENVSPIAGRIGRAYEKYSNIFHEKTGEDMDAILQNLQEVKGSLGFKVVMAVKSPSLLFSFLKRKLTRRA